MSKTNNTPAPITAADLDETLLDRLNGLQALCNELARKLNMSTAQVKLIELGATARAKRAQAEAARVKANKEQYEDDREQMAAWAHANRFTFDNAKDWEKEAAAEWLCITDRNGSEHNAPHNFRYKEPTRKELMEALTEWEKWSNSTSDRPSDIAHRETAIRILPSIKKKLAAALVA